jgi:chitin disaccharide deacetylase
MTSRSSRLVTHPMRRVAEQLKDYAANILTLRRVAGWLASHPRRGATVAERLGYDAKARLLIINADDFGLCREQNLATIEGLESGALTSASVMVPCTGFGEVCEYAKRRPNADLGIHLTLTSEWDRRRWAPVLDKEKVRSLSDADGHFWRSRAELFSFCRPQEAEAELRGQIECALAAGVDVTHLDSHMFILHSQQKKLQEVYLRLANDYSLPLRTAPRTVMHWYGFEGVTEEADRLGILHPDNFAVLSRVRPSNAADFWVSLMKMLPPGLTEICCHPGYAQGDLASFAEDALQREADLQFFTSDRARQIIEAQGIRVVGHRLLRDAMRSSRGNR